MSVSLVTGRHRDLGQPQYPAFCDVGLLAPQPEGTSRIRTWTQPADVVLERGVVRLEHLNYGD